MKSILRYNEDIELAVEGARNNLQATFRFTLMSSSLTELYDKQYPYGIDIKIEKPFELNNFVGRGMSSISNYFVDLDVTLMYPVTIQSYDPSHLTEKKFYI